MKDWFKDINNVRSILPPGHLAHDFIDAGGQGAVYRGQSNGTDCALKVYYPGQLGKRIEREIEALSILNCPTIVKLVSNESILINGHEIFVVSTEFIQGQTLDKYIVSADTSPEFLKRLINCVGIAIEAMWSKRIVHRDLKPSNLIVDQSKNKVSVIDLGLARHLDESTLTALGSTWGTMGFLSPEQCRAVKQLTCKSDIYSLGIIVLLCYLKTHPTGGDQMRFMASKFHESLPNGLDGWVHASLLKRMLDPKPTARPLPSEIIEATR
jgi:serine/threonine protein kinase